MKVFFGEGFGGPAGGVDDADGMAAVEDGDSEGVCPAGVGAGLGEAAGAGDREGRLGGFGDEPYHAPLRRREVPVVAAEGREV